MRYLLFIISFLAIASFCACGDDSDEAKVRINATGIVASGQRTLYNKENFGLYMCHVARLNAKDEGATYRWQVNGTEQKGVTGDTCGFYAMRPDSVCKIDVDINKDGSTKHFSTTVKLDRTIEFAAYGTSLTDLTKNETMYSAVKYGRMPEVTYRRENILGEGMCDVWHFKYKEEDVCHEYTLSDGARGGVMYIVKDRYHKN